MAEQLGNVMVLRTTELRQQAMLAACLDDFALPATADAAARRKRCLTCSASGVPALNTHSAPGSQAGASARSTTSSPGTCATRSARAGCAATSRKKPSAGGPDNANPELTPLWRVQRRWERVITMTTADDRPKDGQILPIEYPVWRFYRLVP